MGKSLIAKAISQVFSHTDHYQALASTAMFSSGMCFYSARRHGISWFALKSPKFNLSNGEIFAFLQDNPLIRYDLASGPDQCVQSVFERNQNTGVLSLISSVFVKRDSDLYRSMIADEWRS